MILLISVLLGIMGLLAALFISLKHKGKVDMKLNFRKMEMELKKDD